MSSEGLNLLFGHLSSIIHRNTICNIRRQQYSYKGACSFALQAATSLGLCIASYSVNMKCLQRVNFYNLATCISHPLNQLGNIMGQQQNWKRAFSCSYSTRVIIFSKSLSYSTLSFCTMDIIISFTMILQCGAKENSLEWPSWVSCSCVYSMSCSIMGTEWRIHDHSNSLDIQYSPLRCNCLYNAYGLHHIGIGKARNRFPQ